MQLFTARRRYA